MQDAETQVTHLDLQRTLPDSQATSQANSPSTSGDERKVDELVHSTTSIQNEMTRDAVVEVPKQTTRESQVVSGAPQTNFIENFQAITSNPSQMTVEMRKLNRNELAAAQKLYSSNGYVTLVKPIDSVFGAFVDGRLVGVARLSPEYEIFVLKGVTVAEKFRHKGIGRRLAQLALDEVKDQDCFMCIEREELQFYNSLGFAHLASDRAPDHLRRKLEQNQRKLKEIFLLKRPAQLS